MKNNFEIKFRACLTAYAEKLKAEGCKRFETHHGDVMKGCYFSAEDADPDQYAVLKFGGVEVCRHDDIDGSISNINLNKTFMKNLWIEDAHRVIVEGKKARFESYYLEDFLPRLIVKFKNLFLKK